ncbi:hypothetical protein HID58_074181 [Brassica napus]|uniref:Uncharacterized protein n=1 Tax=Brassica napus TaxID=3708 RepID=A0ABQ7YG47_BRANA|nr:hypothetical protein HID58_074181 [Brassica napus]
MNLEATRQGSLSLMPQLQWQVYWERDEEAGGEGGASMSELRLFCVTGSSLDIISLPSFGFRRRRLKNSMVASGGLRGLSFLGGSVCLQHIPVPFSALSPSRARFLAFPLLAERSSSVSLYPSGLVL